MQWTQKQIRRTFLDYFAKHAELPHEEVDGSPIIPRDDPTLLFTNAGMNQFKSLLLGQEKRHYTRATAVQKCVRAGGKHNDLDAVGKDGRHLTWFEMLGNWSFGDYYKLKTIQMSWDLSTRVFGLDKERIYISVYKDDDESYAIWRDVIGVPEARIYRFGDIDKGDEENFWSMGPTGPCGPCTELFYDLGPEAGTSADDVMGGEGDRYLEFWNNVFMAYDRDESGTLNPLALKSVDTGMGMERITMLLQGQISVYGTDLFTPLLARIAELAEVDVADPAHKIDMQVIADHIRTLTFVVAEGGQFGNDGRNYVLKRILRRAVRHGRKLGFEGPFLHRLLPTVKALFEGVYALPENILANTAETIRTEEEAFFRTIDRGMARINAMMAAKTEGDRTITGAEAFQLYDTFGFPVDLTRIEAEEHGFEVDEPGFEAEMKAQRERGKANQKFYADEGDWTVLEEGGGLNFAGYGLAEHQTTVCRYRQHEGTVDLVLASTPFYAESGGETADHGRIEGDGFIIEITDVQKLNGIIHHLGTVEGELSIETGAVINAVVDVERRAKKTIHHTATHLLQGALKAVVGAHVAQKGSVVEPDRLRFDFSHKAPLSHAEIEAVESWVNARIRRNDAVIITEDVPIDDARSQGVVALFGEKYGDLVRTVRAGADSFELCGGNHVTRTGDIGHVRITGQSAVGAGVRRIEAVVGHAADALVNADRERLMNAASTLKTDINRLPERVGALLTEVRELKKALEKARRSGGSVDADSLIAAAVEVAGVRCVAAKVSVDSRDTLAGLVDRIRDKLPGGLVVLGAELDGKVALIAAVGPALKGDKRFHAGRLIKGLTALVDGKGGGRPDFAQGGGQSPAKLADAMAQAPALVAELAG